MEVSCMRDTALVDVSSGSFAIDSRSALRAASCATIARSSKRETGVGGEAEGRGSRATEAEAEAEGEGEGEETGEEASGSVVPPAVLMLLLLEATLFC